MRLTSLVSVVLLCLHVVVPQSAAQAPANNEFRKLAARLAQQRLDGVEEKQELQEQALALLDEFALRALNAPATFKLEAVNQQLATWVTQTPPVGENYRLLPLSPGTAPGAADLFVLVANFGLSGPSAVRVYSRTGGTFRLAARIDRFTQPDLFDEYLELLPISPDVFLTVTGRTDELETGGFTAWRFDGREVRPVWASDLLQQSKYEIADGELRLTFCAETDEDRPRVCQKMLRETYRWTAGEWRRTSQTDVPVPKKDLLDDADERYEVVPHLPIMDAPLLRGPWPELQAIPPARPLPRGNLMIQI